MKRRTFLRSATQAGVLAGIARNAAFAQTSDRHQQPGSVPAEPSSALIGAEATAAYFDEAALLAATVAPELTAAKVKVVAFNFPSWHPSPFMEARFGQGWTEFDTLRDARSLYPGHTMPLHPLWGYYNEADALWADREIQLAARYGVDAWMIDWYWHQGTQFYQEQLEQGFLRSADRHKLQFAVMWANHDWKNVYPARSPAEAAMILPQVHTEADFERVANYCAEHYFSQENYLTVDGGPLFAIFDVGKVIEQLQVDGLQRALGRMRERAARLGFPKLHLQVVGGYDRYLPRLGDFGFDSVTQYGTFGWTYGTKPPGSRIPYGIGAREAVASWRTMRGAVSIPFYPCAQVGWDDSPRFGEFSAIAVDRTPDQFERLVRAARHTVADMQTDKLVYVAAWNEWTEGHVLLPDSYWGYSYLEALRRAAHA